MGRDRLRYAHARRQRVDSDWLAYVRIRYAVDDSFARNVRGLGSSYVHGFPYTLRQVVELNPLSRIAVKRVNIPSCATPDDS